MAGEPGPVAAGTFYPGAPDGAKTLRPTEEPLVTLHGLVGTLDSPRRLPRRWSTATATWKSRCVSTPTITATSVSGLSAPIVLTSGSSFRCSGHFATRGAAENGRYCEGSRHRRRAPMRSRRCSGPGRRSGDTGMSGRRVTCKAPLGPTWKEGQAAPRRRPQPSSRILTAWKGYSRKFRVAPVLCSRFQVTLPKGAATFGRRFRITALRRTRVHRGAFSRCWASAPSPPGAIGGRACQFHHIPVRESARLVSSKALCGGRP